MPPRSKNLALTTTSQGLHPGGAAFFRFLGFLFLSIFAAESQAIVVASLVPIFVAALAISALYVHFSLGYRRLTLTTASTGSG